MPVRHEALMSGTTLCPHCDTRFKIAEAQLEAHHGMVRCGHCLQAFDARPGYIPDLPNPQLELPMPDDPMALDSESRDERPDAAGVALTTGETGTAEETGQSGTIPPAVGPEDEALTIAPPAGVPVEPTLAERVAIVQDEDDRELPRAPRRWPWAVGAFLLLLALLAQAAYFFRVDLAARLPGLKPALTGYCRLLKCSIPLPQNTGLMSIESSDLEADDHENRITLNALLRNRAPYPQAFPDLELTLNDNQDKPLARRIFKPKDYLPPQESEQAGLWPDHELIVKLHLGTADLRPTGYRLALLYP